jgi:hypothetical protein
MPDRNGILLAQFSGKEESMFLLEILTALVIGAMFTLLFGALFGRRDGMPGFLLVFGLFFLFAWSGGLWLRPWGPPLWGVYWLPSIVVTLLIFLVFGSFSQRAPRSRREAREQVAASQAATTAVGVLFWVLLFALVISIVVAYLVRAFGELPVV